MLLDFDIEKAIAATAHVIERHGGTDDMFPLIKKIYFADRTALIRWAKPITGDSFASLQKGPIVSGIYNLMKGQGDFGDQVRWDDVIVRHQPYAMTTRKPANKGVLSEREMEVLDESAKIIDAIRGSIPKWLHQYCPEWKDPGRSSIPIDPSTILRLANKSEEEIRRIEEANEEIRLMNYLLGAR